MIRVRERERETDRQTDRQRERMSLSKHNLFRPIFQNAHYVSGVDEDQEENWRLKQQRSLKEDIETSSAVCSQSTILSASSLVRVGASSAPVAENVRERVSLAMIYFSL